MPLKDLFSRHHALRITAIYLAFATLWILASDRVVEALFGDIDLLTHMQTLKGMIFVVVTALMLYLLIARAHLAPKAASANNQLTPWAPLLIFSMLAIAISLTGWYSYNALKRSLEQDVIADLTRTGNLKRTQVEAWLNERRADVIVATHESFLAREAQLFQTSVESPPSLSADTLQARLGTYLTQYGYYSISLFDLKGRLRMHVGVEPVEPDNHRSIILQSIRERKPQFLDFHTHLVDGKEKSFLGFVAPLTFKGEITGALLFYVNPETSLYPTLSQDIAQPKSEESVLVRLEGDQARLLNPQRLSAMPMVWSPITKGSPMTSRRCALPRAISNGWARLWKNHSTKSISSTRNPCISSR